MRHSFGSCRSNSVVGAQTSCSSENQDIVLTTKRELNCYYTMRFAFGPAINVMYIFFPVLLAIQAKEIAGGNTEGIEYRRVSSQGESCTNHNVSVEGAALFQRPDDLPEDCEWFPVNPLIMGLGIHYVAFVSYVVSAIMFGAGMAIWILGPLADNGAMRQHILHLGLMVWPILFSALLLTGDELWLTTIIGSIGLVLFLYNLRTGLHGYAPLLIGTHPDVIGVELLESPAFALNSMRSLPATTRTEKSRLNFGKQGYCLTDRSDTGDDLVSILMTMVTPRDNFKSAPKPRPPGVPRLDLKPVTEAQALLSAVQSPQVFDTERFMEMEHGSRFDDDHQEGNTRLGEVLENLTTNAASAEIFGQALGGVIQTLIVVVFERWITVSSTTLPYQLAIVVASVWAWTFGSYGYSGLKERSLRNKAKGATPFDALFMGVKQIAMGIRNIRDSLPDVFLLQLAEAIMMVGVRSLQVMATVFLVVEFGFTPWKLALAILVYALVSPFSTIVLYLMVWLCSGPPAKLNLLKVFSLALCGASWWFSYGLHSLGDVFMGTALLSALISPLPTIFWSLRADIVPSICMTQVLTINDYMESLLWWTGPLVIGLIVETTHSLHAGLLTCCGMILLPIPILFCMDMGQAASRKMNIELHKH